MDQQRTRYPEYNVLSQAAEWDPHTREIVMKRLGPFPELTFLTRAESKILKVIAKHLVYDQREDILDFIIYHIDQTLNSNIGESERKPEAPPAKDLIRFGLVAIDNVARKTSQKSFTELDMENQFKIIASLQTKTMEPLGDWKRVPPKELFKKLVGLITSAYYSHPTVWSEIGYGGPAYPRGYVRTEHGLTDPWEASRDV